MDPLRQEEEEDMGQGKIEIKRIENPATSKSHSPSATVIY
jgi:hypothetical protein